MRTIKFRGKCAKGSRYAGEWVYGSCVQCEKSDDVLITVAFNDRCSCTYHVDPDTVGQFTGLYDKNGYDIFEGDIIQSESGEFVYQVVFNETRFASFGLRRKKDMFLHYFGEAIEADECEVIGNVFDNPELLKGGEE